MRGGRGRGSERERRRERGGETEPHMVRLSLYPCKPGHDFRHQTLFPVVLFTRKNPRLPSVPFSLQHPETLEDYRLSTDLTPTPIFFKTGFPCVALAVFKLSKRDTLASAS